MSYTRINWADKEVGGTKLNATNLNVMDKGISDNAIDIATLKTRADTFEVTLEQKVTAIEGYMESIGNGIANAVDVVYDSKTIGTLSATADAYITYLIEQGYKYFYIISQEDYDELVSNTINPPTDADGNLLDVDTIDDDRYYLIIDTGNIVAFKLGQNDVIFSTDAITYTIKTDESDISTLADVDDTSSSDTTDDTEEIRTSFTLTEILDKILDKEYALQTEYTHESNDTIATVKDALDYILDYISSHTI